MHHGQRKPAATELFERLHDALHLRARISSLDSFAVERWVEHEMFFRAPVADHREHRRWEVSIPASLQCGEAARSGLLADVSLGGAFVELARPLAIGTKGVLRLGPIHTGHEWHLPFTVVRVQLDPGRRKGCALRWQGAPVALVHHYATPLAGRAS